LEPFSPEAGPSRTRSIQIPTLKPAAWPGVSIEESAANKASEMAEVYEALGQLGRDEPASG